LINEETTDQQVPETEELEETTDEPVTEEIKIDSEIETSPKNEAFSPEESEELVLPGDIIGTSEEFIPGNNTFKKSGNIYSTATGLIKINAKTRNISVIPETDVPPMIEKGDVVIGRVNDLRSSMVLVEIAKIEGKGDREIVNLQNAAIHVSNIKDSYVKDVMFEFSPFDIIKAKVIDLKTMRLTTSGKDLGVIKAYCGKCHLAMDKASDNGEKSNTLKCPVCGNIESRKLSSDYGITIV
jgi:exosome complex component CSL4